MFGGGKPGEVADLFNRTAKAIAVLSFAPGGVTVFGQHWEAQHPDLVPPPQENEDPKP
ncbi:MAG: hypothetical protein AABZ30_16140 [Myxococcota bacterium]